MHLRAVFSFLSISIAFCGSMPNVCAIEANSSEVPWEKLPPGIPDPMIRADADDYLKWVDAQLIDSENTKILPVATVQILLARVNAGAFVTPGNVRRTATAIQRSQFDLPNKKEPLPPDATVPWVRSFLRQVFTTAKLPALRIAAGEQLAESLERGKLFDEAIVVRSKLINECTQLESESMNSLQRNKLDAAPRLFQNNKKSEAETLFLEVTSYPWYLLAGKEIQTFRDYYVGGVIGLIDTRRGKLQKLKEIYIVPACREKLEPYLNRAIKEAEQGK